MSGKGKRPPQQIKKEFFINKKTGKRFYVNDVVASTRVPEDPALAGDFTDHIKYNEKQLPPKVDLRQWMTPIEDQGDMNSCTANALAGAFEYMIKKAKNVHVDLSRLFIYYNTRIKDIHHKVSTPPLTDEGSSVQSGIEILKEIGVCSESVWNYEKRIVNTKPTTESYSAAEKFKITAAFYVDVDLNEMKSCLAQGFPFVFSLQLFVTFPKCGKSKGVIPAPKVDDKDRGEHGNHAMLAVGYSDKSKAFIVRNSWGQDWGHNGYCYIPYEYMTNEAYCSGLCAMKHEGDFDLGTDQWNMEDATDYLDEYEEEESGEDDEEDEFSMGEVEVEDELIDDSDDEDNRDSDPEE